MYKVGVGRVITRMQLPGAPIMLTSWEWTSKQCVFKYDPFRQEAYQITNRDFNFYMSVSVCVNGRHLYCYEWQRHAWTKYLDVSSTSKMHKVPLRVP